MKPSKPSCGGRWLPGAEDRKREKWEIEKIEKSVPKENREKSVPEENRERKRRAQAALIVESSSNDGGAREREREMRENRVLYKSKLLGRHFQREFGLVDVKAEARKTLSEVDRKLKLLNKPAIKSIKSEDEDIIDCVDIYKQPAFDHPALRNHKIQAAYLRTTGSGYVGARGDINIWSPRIDLADDYSSAQIWLEGTNGNKFESIEVGWMANPKLFGDKQPRVFVRWTLDAYEKTGCINLICSGFVQTSQKIALGSAINPVSQDQGTQYEIKIRIDKDPNNGRWWLQFQDEAIGYWPGEILNALKQNAATVKWGGDVYSKNVKGVTPHTNTAMGSGNTPTLNPTTGNFGHACFIRNLRIVDNSLQVKFPEAPQYVVEENNCYGTYQNNTATEPLFYFGGPSLNRGLCR
uniref:Neprosin PEP catalytic domain-containing protein n=1 Tax=Fagus sylvatica TaxID=28930 RepID=A0A2N9GWH5_FAGSY